MKNKRIGALYNAVRIYRKKAFAAVRITLFALGVLFLALLVALAVDLASARIEYHLELGEELPNAYTLSGGKTGAVYDFGSADGSFDEPGEYEIYIVYGGRRVKVKLIVADTKPPKADFLVLDLHQGTEAAAIDFFKNVTDASEYTAKFTKNNIKPQELGTYAVEIELSDKYGNKKNYEANVNVVVDTQPPSINAPEAITGFVGEGVAYMTGVEVIDNCFGATVTVDSSAVNTSKEGTYKAVYTATDAAGNTSTLEVPVNIYVDNITDEKLLARIGEKAAALGITKNMSKEEQVKRIYAYVCSESTIDFVDVSLTDRSDWRREAWLALDRGNGDCYTYFALSKAFFLYFGIENRDIQRTPGAAVDGNTSGTHFWHMVNIGDSKNPRWYYYDATVLAGSFKLGGNGCLFTEAQRQSYVTRRGDAGGGFYKFDSTGYPTVETKIINK